MDIIIFFPIGGIIAAFLILLGLGFYGIWDALQNSQEGILNFANEYTDVFSIIFLILSIIIGIGLVIFIESSHNKEKVSQFTVFRSVFTSANIFFCLLSCYIWIIGWASESLGNFSDMPLVTLLISPLLILLLIVILVLLIIPNFLNIIPEIFEFKGKIGLIVYPIIINIALLCGYLWWLNDFDFISFLVNSF